MRHLALCICVSLMLCACGKPAETPPASAPATEVSPAAPAAPDVATPPAEAPPGTSAAASPGLPAGERVTAFLAAYQAQMFRGLPKTEQAAALAEHFSPRLNGLFADALAGQEAYKAKYPTDKPPMIDGDIFSSLFEGATTGTVESVEASGDAAVARVLYVYAEPDTGKVIQTWSDQFLMVRAGEDWLIDDVEYLGGWDFSPKGRLSAALAETAALRD